MCRGAMPAGLPPGWPDVQVAQQRSQRTPACTYVMPLTVLCPCCLNPSFVVPGLLSRGVAAPRRGALLLLPPQPPRPAVAWAAARCRFHGGCACGLSKQPFAAACVWGDSHHQSTIRLLVSLPACQVDATVAEQRQKLEDAQGWQAQLQDRLEQLQGEVATLEEAAEQVRGGCCCC